MSEDIKDRLSRHYDERYANARRPDKVPIRRYPKNRFESAVKLVVSGNRLLEIGCGTGNVLLTVRPQFKECVATELSTPRVEQLSKTFANDPDVQILRHNVETEKLPFPDEYFDTVLMIAIVEHLVDSIAALREIHRVLKNKGRLFINTPNIAKWTRCLKLLAGYFPATGSMDEGLTNYDGSSTNLCDEGHFHYFTFRSLLKVLIERVGFSKAIPHGYGKFGPLASLIPTLFSDDVVFVAIR